MPTYAFFNLSEEKRKKIIKAAVDEFSEKLFVDASINKIIKAIDMPRGSFYLYFENKEDLYSYILELYSDLFIDKIKEILLTNKGDLIKTFVDLFDYIIANTNGNDMQRFIYNIFLNMNTKNINIIFDKESHKSKLLSIINLIDKDKLRIDNNEDTMYIMQILMMLLIHSLAHCFSCGNDKNIRDIYIRKLHIIRKGLYV